MHIQYIRGCVYLVCTFVRSDVCVILIPFYLLMRKHEHRDKGKSLVPLPFVDRLFVLPAFQTELVFWEHYK